MSKKLTLVGFIAAILAVLPLSVVSAASPSISRSYSSTTSIPTGSLVALTSAKSSSIELANSSNAKHLIGVDVGSHQSLLEVNQAKNTVQVATTGVVNTLVSSVNGNIKAGQEIAASPFNGVGMKAVNGDRVIGTALTSFNQSTPGAVTEKVSDSYGHTHHITIGYVRLSISIGQMTNSALSLVSLQQFIEGITGHPVSVLRLVVSVVVAFVAILSIVTLIYASIYGSIVSIGRNPLAKSAVFRTLTSIFGMIALIAGVASVTIYFLLY